MPRRASVRSLPAGLLALAACRRRRKISPRSHESSPRADPARTARVRPYHCRSQPLRIPPNRFRPPETPVQAHIRPTPPRRRRAAAQPGGGSARVRSRVRIRQNGRAAAANSRPIGRARHESAGTSCIAVCASSPSPPPTPTGARILCTSLPRRYTQASGARPIRCGGSTSDDGAFYLIVIPGPNGSEVALIATTGVPPPRQAKQGGCATSARCPIPLS